MTNALAFFHGGFNRRQGDQTHSQLAVEWAQERAVLRAEQSLDTPA